MMKQDNDKLEDGNTSCDNLNHRLFFLVELIFNYIEDDIFGRIRFHIGLEMHGWKNLFEF